MNKSMRLFLCKTTKGFTLIEIIVALAVVSVAITGLVQMFSLSLNLSQTSQNVILASSIAHDKLNYVLNCPDKFIWKIPADLKPGGDFSYSYFK
jgi:prepilin-type N-terminal cleavage/methylation domain-containing protein